MKKRISLLRRQAARLPRIPLTQLPTPMQECPRFSREIGCSVRLFMKRDDLIMTGFGGNKIRKLEFSLGRARAEGCDVVVHGLAGQSNYCRQTAAACAMVGMPCHLVLRKDHKAEDPPQANRLLDYVFGAEVTMVPSLEQREAKGRLVDKLKAEGHKPYLIGRDDEVLGAVAYSLCLAEILEQLVEQDMTPDAVCVTGSAGTQSGLILGKRLLGFEGQVYGFEPAVCKDEAAKRAGVADVVNDAARLLGVNESFSAADVNNTSAYAGEKYGIPTPECLVVIGLLGRTEGLVVGPVYTAKGLAGTIDFIRTGRIAAGSTVVFVHTGGTPEVFAYNVEISAALMQPSASAE